MSKVDTAAVKVYVCTDCTLIVAWPQTVKPSLSQQCMCFVPRHTKMEYVNRRTLA
jgi:hypothetical protein